MTKFPAFLSLLLALSSPANAGTMQIGGQWDIPPGGGQQLTCLSGSKAYSQCVHLPAGTRILGWSGSQTVKAPNIEILAGAACDGQVMWTYEHFQGTYLITSPAKLPTDFAGSTCASYWEWGNKGAYCASCLEINVTIYYCMPGEDCPP